jgi:radical SAM protein with 4Fe4S-binding SPASM domain
LVWPLSWVKQRIDSDRSLIGSAMAAGTEVAVLPYGDLYAGECCVGMDQWRLGNVLQSHSAIAWERVDALPEAFSRSTAPARCKTCDWRYRCGGVDPAVRLAQDRHRVTSCDEWSEWCELYCAPRKALFEEMLWDSVEAAAGQNEQRPRERIELHEDGLTYQAVRIATEPQPERTSSTSTQQGGKAGIERGAPSIEEEQAFGREAVGAAPGGVTR